MLILKRYLGGRMDRKISDGKVELDLDKYLLFEIGGECFGTPLLGVREVVESQKVKPIPNTTKHFLGVINIRGEIVGVTDLRIKIGCEAKEMGFESMVVFKCDAGPIAALVDSVIAVASILDTDIDTNLGIDSHFSNEYLVGVAKHQDQLITIINLNKILSTETMMEINNNKLREAI